MNRALPSLGRRPCLLQAAFGRGMCPKLVGEVKSAKRAVRVNALAVLCDELRNPISVVGCVEAGVVDVLNDQVKADPDALTRKRASKALEICARDANGRTSMLKCATPQAVFGALDDTEDEVRSNVYEALIRLSDGDFKGMQALIAANYPATLVGKAAKEVVSLQPKALMLLKNCLADDAGLHDALANSAVETCISLLASLDVDVRTEAATTLATLCFAEMAKMTAISGGAVPELVSLLGDSAQAVRAAGAGALMAITTTDEGKRLMVPDGDGDIASVALLVGLLREDSVALKANTLKLIANVAVHPRAREQLKLSPDCITLLKDLCASESPMLAKHAQIAKKAVMFRP
mmetsp:Transcript_26767/g.95536  ORF Transcript_26767/g.95536 Transcript_26767/m.95536 type:complete len:349 (-) Transcript_26767:95-1141(-)